MKYDTITFIGRNENHRAVIEAAQHDWYGHNCFGTTVSDGNYLDVVMYDNATIDDVDELINFAENNGCFINGITAKMLSERFNDAFSSCV